MQRRYTVLRAIRPPRTREPFGGGLIGAGLESFAVTPPETRVEVADFNAKELRDVGRDPEVAGVAPIMPIKLALPLDVVGQPQASSAWGISAVGADASRFDGSGVTIAVLDTGIAPAHPAFQGVTLVQEDFTGSGNGDAHGHGTHCAGTIFGRDVNGTRIGVARGVGKALIGKVLGATGGGGSDSLFQAIEWALNQGARVISMSLGFDFPGAVQKSVEEDGVRPDVATSLALEAYRANLRTFDALMQLAFARAAFDGGAVIVAASGNESGRDQQPPYEIAVSVPAAAEGVVSVGALAQTSPNSYSVAPFSNTLPEVSAPGVNVLSANKNGGLVALSGTSMATPHVAGVAALWWQALLEGSPATKASQVVAKLIATARAGGIAPEFDAGDRGMGLVTAP